MFQPPLTTPEGDRTTSHRSIFGAGRVILPFLSEVKETLMEYRTRIQYGISQLKKSASAFKNAQDVQVNICPTGIAITDLKTGEILHEHKVNKVSLITGDMSDLKMFHFVCDAEGQYQVFTTENEQQVETLVIGLDDLFKLIFNKMKRRTQCLKKNSNYLLEDMCSQETLPAQDFYQENYPGLLKPPPLNKNAGRRKRQNMEMTGDMPDRVTAVLIDI